MQKLTMSTSVPIMTLDGSRSPWCLTELGSSGKSVASSLGPLWRAPTYHVEISLQLLHVTKNDITVSKTVLW